MEREFQASDQEQTSLVAEYKEVGIFDMPYLNRAKNAIAVAVPLLLCTFFASPIYAQVSITQTNRYLASDGGEGKHFGSSVALSGTVALVGAGLDDLPLANDTIVNAGSAYLLKDTVGGSIRTKLTASNPIANENFGWSVALTQELALIGSRQGQAGGIGAAYLFNAATGGEVAILQPEDGVPTDEFGWSVALSGNTALVGSPADDISGSDDQGSVYVFSTITGQQISKLTAEDGGRLDGFGFATALSGNLAVIGAPQHNTGVVRSGAAYVFDVISGQQLSKLVATDSDTFLIANFGSSVSLFGDFALVGAYSADANRGAAYLFNALTGVQIAKIQASDGQGPDYFGSSVALYGSFAAIGAPSSIDPTYRRGSAYLFDLSDLNNIRELGSFTSLEGHRGDMFGSAVALSDNVTLVGASNEDNNPGTTGNQGAAYTFTFVAVSSAAPEPGTLALVITAVLAVGLRRRFRTR